MHPFSQRGLGKAGQCSDIAEPGAGLLGNVKCTFRGLETLGGHKDWFGRSWEGLLGRPWPKRPWQGLKRSIGRSWPGGKVEGYSHFCPPDHGLLRSSCMPTYKCSRMAGQFLRG